jgi:Alw26I/Eco31I/Esp3I family type II restriction m6 adenine DNA methyltransferase
MSMSVDLTPKEMDRLKEIVEDLGYIFSLEEIDAANVYEVIGRLRSEEVKSYLQNLCMGSKPESALREALFAGNSILGKYLYGYAAAPPEVTEDGFVDYLITDQFGHTIILELKSLFDTVKERDRAGKVVVKKLRQQRLSWEAHKDQIKRYITKGEYVILTNLKEWVFFSRSLNPADPRPFYSTSLSELIKDYEVIRNLKDYADRKEYQSVRYELDKKFLGSLKEWVRKLSEVEFTVDDKRKLELIIGLINKFVFIQTLDDYGVIEFKWIQKKWDTFERDWASKSKLTVLEEFLSYVNRFFFKYYDTELFKENFLDYVKKDPDNIERLYDNFRMVLGLTYLQTPIEFKGIMQYNFRLIDEDVLGKAYESFLAEQRKEQGAYYTPKYITEYIVENTVGRLYDELLKEIEASLESEDFDRALELVRRFTSIKVLDPACGSGSFLIKALRKIKSEYDELIKIVARVEERYCDSSSLDPILSKQDKLERIKEMKDIIGPGDSRELISRLIVRHIHGNDVDRRALEVAKVNIWLEAIKLSPSEFRFDKLPSRVEHILPDLRMNFGNGDSLISLPFEDTINYLATRFKKELSELSKLRCEYLNNPANPSSVEKIENIKQEIRNNLDLEFNKFLSDNSPVERKAAKKIDLTKLFGLTKPFYWCLGFWFVYFDGKGEPLSPKESGFDVIIGNPPYGRIKQLIEEKEVKEIYSKFYDIAYSYQRGNYNYYKLFLERCFYLLKDSGFFSMIFPTAFLGEQDSQPLRKLFFENVRILKILQFPEKTRVFSDVTQDVIVLVYRKTKLDADYSFEIRTNITGEELERLSELDFLELKVSEVREVTGEDYRIPVFAKPKEEWAILRKISKMPPFKGDDKVPSVGEVGVGHLDETFDKDYLSEEDTGDLVVKGIHLDQYFVNLDPDGPQPRWVRKDAFLEKKTEAKENIKYERIIGRNTLNRAIRPRLKFTLLRPGFVITNAIKYLILKNTNLNKYYVIGLLNSSLLNWRFELFSSQNNIRNYEIEDLPFYRAETNVQSAIADAVKTIIELKNARYRWFKIWNLWQARMKNSETTLQNILLQDLDALRYGETEDLWSSNATIYPEPESELLAKSFDEFEVIGDKRTLKIYGVLEDSYELIEEIEFTDDRLMRIVYASIHSLLEYRSQLSTLSQLLQKTKVPLIRPDEKRNTVNILLRVENEFNNWKVQEGLTTIPSDIVEIDNEINNLVAKVDYSVFQLYGLNEQEAKVVLDSLKIKPTYRDRVLKQFKGATNV